MSWIWALPGAYLLSVLWHRFRPAPPGVNPPPRSFRVREEELRLSWNLTWREGEGEIGPDGEGLGHRLGLADDVVELIGGARELVLCDFFLFNLHRTDEADFLPNTRRVCDALAARPELPRVFLADPANTLYGTARCEPLEWLEEAGVEVHLVDPSRLPDHNLLYAPIHRLLLQWLGTGRGGALEHPLRPERRTSVRALLTAATGRGNHRKVVIADDRVLVGSGNLKDSSCYYDDLGVVVRSRALARHLLRNEAAIVRMSGGSLPFEAADEEPEEAEEGEVEVTFLTGADIRRSILRDLRGVGAGDSVDVAMLFLSDRASMRELVAASRRGARVTVVLDGGIDNRGRRKPTNPNRAVAWELRRRAPEMRLRQVELPLVECHLKNVVIRRAGRMVLHAGSANLTRRSLVGTNLEANLRLDLREGSDLAEEVRRYHERLASSGCSEPFEPGRMPLASYLLYRAQEHSGFAMF